MNSFMYCGINISEQNCHVPQSRFINGINEIIDLLKTENNIKKAIDQNEEVFGASVLRKNEMIICHIHDYKISLSKIQKQKLSELNDEDIFELLTNDPIHTFTRNINKQTGAALRKEYLLKDHIIPEIINNICQKDSSNKNLHSLKGLDFKDNAKTIESKTEFEEILHNFPNKHNIEDINISLRDGIKEAKKKSVSHSHSSISEYIKDYIKNPHTSSQDSTNFDDEYQ